LCFAWNSADLMSANSRGRIPQTLRLMERVTVDAHVIEVVRGEYSEPTVRVAIGGSSCDSPFIFGRRGLIIGEFVTPEAGQARYNAAQIDIPEGWRMTWPFDETVFDAMTESRDERLSRSTTEGGRR